MKIYVHAPWVTDNIFHVESSCEVEYFKSLVHGRTGTLPENQSLWLFGTEIKGGKLADYNIQDGDVLTIYRTEVENENTIIKIVNSETNAEIGGISRKDVREANTLPYLEEVIRGMISWDLFVDHENNPVSYCFTYEQDYSVLGVDYWETFVKGLSRILVVRENSR